MRTSFTGFGLLLLLATRSAALSVCRPTSSVQPRCSHGAPPMMSAISRRHFALSVTAAAGGAASALPASAGGLFDLRTTLSALQQQEQTVEDLFLRSTPSVVYISTFIAKTDRLTMNAVEVPAGTGSGFIWDDQGHIVTNFHVIRGANQAKVGVIGPNGDTKLFGATLVGYNPDKDVAVLKINSDGGKLLPLARGSSADLRVGSTALAIGNPFGLDHSLTVGVISGLGREVISPSGRPITNVIQTDAAINPGNSGGALLDSSGRLIGMNTAIYSPSGASAGIGFAIPVDTLKQQVSAILKFGKVLRPAIGISLIGPAQARNLGVDRGVLVLGVPANSQAATAGLRPTIRRADGSIELGDVITAIDATAVNTESDLYRALDTYEPGQTVTLTVVRLVKVDDSTVPRGRGRGAPVIEYRQTEAKLRIQLQAIEAA